MLWAYNLETVLAEKIETILSRGVANTRPRDYYDIYILWMLRHEECDLATLSLALKRTAKKRGSLGVIEKYNDVISQIEESYQLQNFWNKYTKDFDYAKDIKFADICKLVRKVMDMISAN